MKNKKWLQLAIFAIVLVLAIYTVAINSREEQALVAKGAMAPDFIVAGLDGTLNVFVGEMSENDISTRIDKLLQGQ